MNTFLYYLVRYILQLAQIKKWGNKVMQVSLHQLKLFCTVIEKGSITRASEALYISQPALSTQLKRLEANLGMRLIERVNGNLILTDAGRLLYKSASSIIKHMHAVERQILDLKKGVTGSISVGVSHTGVLYLCADILRDFHTKHPQCEITLYVSAADQIFERLLEGAIDVAFEWQPITVKGLKVTPLCPVGFVGIISPTHHLTACEILPLELFLQAPYIAMQYGVGQNGLRVEGYIEAFLLERRLLPKVIMRFPSIDVVKRVVESGMGISIVSKMSALRELQQGYLKAIRIENIDMVRTAVIITRENQEISPFINSFIEYTKQYVTAFDKMEAFK